MMTRLEDVIEDPVLRLRYVFRRSSPEVLQIELWIEPGGGVTPHVHPRMRERFEVLEGRPEFLAGRRWQAAGPGEEVVVDSGVRHAFRNRGDAVAHVMCEATPPLTLQEFLTDAAAMARAGKFIRPGIPRPSGVVPAAMLIKRHRDMVVLSNPPPFLQPLLFPLARLGERRAR
jgi:quercetin dioxygenase-like cupin family protein